MNIFSTSPPPKIAVIGAGPAGLMAAETLANNGILVNIYDAMPSAGRKFLLAGKSGLNLTHSEPYEKFISRYGDNAQWIKPYLDNFPPKAFQKWSHKLGIETFVGSSGKVFPEGMSALPMLNAWLKRLREQGVNFHFRHRWLGWDEKNNLRFNTAQGEVLAAADGVILALGGGSRPKTGSNAAWIPILEERGIQIAPLKASNCGFDIQWTDFLKERFAGHPIKSIRLSFGGKAQRGEFVISENSIEGSLVYAFSATLRDEIEKNGSATIQLDLMPDWTEEKLRKALSATRGSRSMGTFLKKRIGLSGAKAALLWEVLPRENTPDLGLVGATLKSLELKLIAPRPLEEAISSAGGIRLNELDENLMLHKLPGVFCAGEMLDWEAPTGGYLLTACFATGRAAGKGALRRLSRRQI
ncbi:MAG: TIGR03862 family flavoprotein [Anaerolineae bacterium]|nr:TIGR03862 family flavoprotein [Anaerolineae bacterium]